MHDDPWQQEIDRENLPGVTRRQIFDLVRELADSQATYDRFKEAEGKPNAKEIVRDLLRQRGITLPPQWLKEFHLPTRKELAEYVDAQEDNSEMWTEIVHPPLFSMFWPFGGVPHPPPHKVSDDDE